MYRLSGAGDKEREACGNTLDRSEAGTWDLYQAKGIAKSIYFINEMFLLLI